MWNNVSSFKTYFQGKPNTINQQTGYQQSPISSKMPDIKRELACDQVCFSGGINDTEEAALKKSLGMLLGGPEKADEVIARMQAIAEAPISDDEKRQATKELIRKVTIENNLDFVLANKRAQSSAERLTEAIRTGHNPGPFIKMTRERADRLAAVADADYQKIESSWDAYPKIEQ